MAIISGVNTLLTSPFRNWTNQDLFAPNGDNSGIEARASHTINLDQDNGEDVIYDIYNTSSSYINSTRDTLRGVEDYSLTISNFDPQRDVVYTDLSWWNIYAVLDGNDTKVGRSDWAVFGDYSPIDTLYIFKDLRPEELGFSFYPEKGVYGVNSDSKPTFVRDSYQVSHEFLIDKYGPARPIFPKEQDKSIYEFYDEPDPESTSITIAIASQLVSEQGTEIVIPSGYTSIENSAFYQYELTSVEIPNTITSIGDSAFKDNKLSSIDIPNSVTSIGEDAFMLNQIKSIEIPDSVTFLGEHAFKLNGLESLTIGKGIKHIDEDAFSSYGLTSLELPNSLKTIGALAFMDNELSSVVIGDKVTTIGNAAFKGNKLKSVEIPNSVTSIGSSAFESNELERIDLGNSVASLGYQSFAYNVLKNVDIPDSLTAQDHSFRNNPLETISVASDSTLDLSEYGYQRWDGWQGAKIIPKETSTPTLTPEPTDTEPAKQVFDGKIKSLDDITTSDKISTFELSKSIRTRKHNMKNIILSDWNNVNVGTWGNDQITGTSESEVFAGGSGRDVLKGGEGSDGFLLQNLHGFGKKKADVIKDYDSGQGDVLLIDSSVRSFQKGKKRRLKIVNGMKNLKKQSKSKNTFIYEQKKGHLYFNENANGKGWGYGGLFAILENSPELSMSDFSIV